MSQFGASGSVAPSSAVTGYAFRHAAAVSRWAGQGSVIDRLTDPRGYTGAHKHRFDADGRGRGLDGREGGADLDFVRASMPGGTKASGALRSAPVLALPGGGQTAGYGKVASSRSGAGE
jgi:hypothetical protein